ncbi:MAG: class I SAM-dependent RNA methyltransferase [Actinobacteria bacterium]|nr:class I SAM-dependent RNA methyltransferase [Actinomycetota bacterium]
MKEKEPTVEVDLHGIAHGGEAVGRLPDGRAVFVGRAIPGERVRIRVVEDKKRWARAELVEVVTPSPDRVEPPCPYVPECGGCDLQHVVPARQRVMKTRVVREQLERLGGIEAPPVDEIRAVGPDVRYRESARFHAADDGRLGFHAAGSHEVVPIADCLILHELSQLLREEVGDRTGASEVTVRAPYSGRVAVLHPGPGPLDIPEGSFDVALAQPDGSVAPLRGDGVMSSIIAGFTYRYDASCFFQVNPGGAEAIVEEVLTAVGAVGGRHVWDLYAGVGLLSLPLAAGGAVVTAVEGHAPATAWARRNAGEAGVDVEVVTAPVERFVGEVSRDPGVRRPDVVVLDPPRRGAGADLAADLAALGPEVIAYVACDVAALARDTRALTRSGYRLTRAVPLDLFPMTHHIEVVARFVRS